jgi:hypothetical protein
MLNILEANSPLGQFYTTNQLRLYAASNIKAFNLFNSMIIHKAVVKGF